MTDSCGILTIPGRQFPVDIFYSANPVGNYVVAAVETVWNIHLSEPEGSVLVFLTGQEEIEEMIKLLTEKEASSKQHPKLMKLQVCLLPLPLPVFSVNFPLIPLGFADVCGSSPR